MKVITKCTISIETLQTIDEESYEYIGDIAECKGGGGGSSGSGAVSYPAYMEAVHGSWLNHAGADTISDSITDVMNAAIGSSPWVGRVAYDPDADLVNLLAAPDALQTLVTLLSSGTTLDTLISNILDPSRIDDVVDEYAADLDDRLNAEILPRFEAGMRDINMVVSSAFAIGKANIEKNQDRQVARFSAELHNKAESDDAISVINLKLEYQKAVSHMIAESYRLKLVAKGEENETNMKIDESDALWDLEVFTHGANVLASVSGGVGHRQKEVSKMQTALGGAMSGAALGMMMAGAAKGGLTGPQGAAIGAGIGLAAAFMMD